ncbi:hypothetical protein DSO57_1014910 [Entomophthora muscae]|uniref:Uncharacterized protein n=1 Tax=Entomophthora muscae TaxID=34485 RepID=A0ACC2T667_9FUNG|nr:hypothetical protein DSO57_1014910 [Entomophthora muscae]
MFKFQCLLGSTAKGGLAKLKFAKLQTSIIEILDRNEILTSEKKEMVAIATEFYMGLFAKSRTCKQAKEATQLTQPITKGEVQRALKEAPKDILCEELVALFNHCLNHNAQIPGGNIVTPKA